ncbi:MAG: NTP transferase domain-containing protein [Bacteroidetes bacterium]|nr:NTP transferase domain-containing protein [Bacteroidota bacterium]
MLASARTGHLATADQAGVPHVIPVCFAVEGDVIYSVLDQKPKRTSLTRLRRVRNILANPQVALVVDHYEDAGPLAGLHAGLTAAQTPWVLAVACDMPFITPEVLHALLAARGPDVAAVVARTPDGRCHPLCACYHQRTVPVVEAHLAAGTLAMHALLDHLDKVKYVDLPAGPLRNVNHLSDLDEWGNTLQKDSC